MRPDAGIVEQAQRPCPPHGFTLIETIMVIAMIGLLIALLMPQLSGVRQASQRATSLSNLRNHVQVFTMYTGDYDGQFPFFMRPDAPETIIRGGGLATRVPLKHLFWALSAYWPVALAPYYDDVAYHDSTFTPHARGQSASYMTYHYSNNFVATPDYWRPETRLAGTSQYRPIRQNQVRHPANKGLMLDTWSFYAGDMARWPPQADGAVLAGVVDGSARSITRDSLAPTYTPGPPEHPMATWPIIHTVGGVEAIDVP